MGRDGRPRGLQAEESDQLLQLSGLPLSPAHLYLKAAALGCIAVPVHAVLCASPWRRALALAAAVLLGLAAFGVVLSMLQRPFYGKAPTLDQALNFVVFLQFAAHTLWLPLLLGLASGARRVRGVAPIVLAGLLVFGLAPLLGARLTGVDMAKACLDTFLSTPFAGDRHARRVGKLSHPDFAKDPA